MNFRGGVIIIGSLLWEDTPTRCKWRQVYLGSVDKKVGIPIRIRYGRESSTRNDTFTMIISQHPSTEFGQGLVVPFNEQIRNFTQLESQALALAKAEGFWTEKGPSLNKRWGTVGLLINPDIDKKNKEGADIVRSRWTNLYAQYNFDNSQYSLSTEEPPIDKNGFLKIEWTEEMKEFDFLLATPVVPKPKAVLTAKQIANRMKEKSYRLYFDSNLKNSIKTFQDLEILTELE